MSSVLDAALAAAPGLFSKEKPFALAGEKTCAGWRCRLLLADFIDKDIAAPLLDATQLRALAAECSRMADLFDERVDWDRIDQS